MCERISMDAVGSELASLHEDVEVDVWDYETTYDREYENTSSCIWPGSIEACV